MSRTQNSIKNAFYGVIGQLLTIVLQFITRKVFIKTLGYEYLGISGLFTNILTVLSLAELGVGSAIVFNLYKPLAYNDTKHICQLMNLYKKAYHFIGAIVTCLGLLFLPILNIIVKEDTSYVNIHIVFVIYLLQTVSSYFFYAYKRALLEASQKEYVVSFVGYITTVLSNLFQILVLLLTKNYIYYVATTVLFTVLNNILVGFACNRIYPYVKEKVTEKLPKFEKTELLKNCSAIFIYKVNSVIQNATDNIILSQMTGLISIGIYSNYHLIFITITMFINKIYTPIKASIGNLHAEENSKHEEIVFSRLNFITFLLFTIISVGVAVLGNEFIKLFFGNDSLLNGWMPVLIAVKLYIEGTKKLLSSFREAMGLFQQAKYRPLAGAIINLIASVIAVKKCGVYGVVIGTIVADLTTYMWFDPYIIYKYGLKKDVKQYGITNIKYAVIFIALIFIAFITIKPITIGGILGFIIKGIISVILTTMIISALFYKNSNFIYFKNLIKNIISKY